MSDVLSPRALNRATLCRQRLLPRGDEPVDFELEETIEHLLGLQSQNPLDPYFALAARFDDFDPDRLGRLLVDRVVVRAALMRGTLHLVTSRDYRKLRPTFAPVLERVFNSTGFASDVADVNRSKLLQLADEVLTEEPITRAELGRRLEPHWPGSPGGSLGQAATYLLPVLQTTPRGVWGSKGAATWTTARSWLGHQDWTPEPPEDVVLRYLGSFGPASVSDIRVWSGLTGLRAVVDGLGDRLRVWKSQDGAELFDLPDAPCPDPETPAPPRFLPEYDNVLLGHADRSRFFVDGATSKGWARNVLVDGFYAGSWKLEESRSSRRIVVTLDHKMSRRQRDELASEGHRLLGALYGNDRETAVEIPD